MTAIARTILAIAATATIASLLGCSGSNASPIQTPVEPPVTATATPVLTLSPGPCPIQIVTITEATAGATIYYTTDGSTPTTNSSVYSAPLQLSSATFTINAIAVKSGYTQSSEATLANTAATTASAPAYFQLPGPYNQIPNAGLPITLTSSTSGASIYYTTDGTTPTANSNLYNGTAVNIHPTQSSGVAFQAIAAASGYATSCIAQGTYSYIPPSSSSNIATVTVGTTPGIAIPGNFAGISEDHNEASQWWGQSASGTCGGTYANGSAKPVCMVNSAQRQLLNNLIQQTGSAIFLRVEGDGAMAPNDDNGTYYNNCTNVSGTTADYPQYLEDSNGSSPGSNPQTYSLMEPLIELLEDVNVQVTLGIDLACNQNSSSTANPWAQTEATTYFSKIGSTLLPKVVAIELGNEPDNYVSQSYRPGVTSSQYSTFPASCPGSTSTFLCDWQQAQSEVNAAAASTLSNYTVAYMGPSTAGSGFISGVEGNLGNTFKARIVSQHNYPIAKSALCTSQQIAGGVTTCNAPDLLLQPSSVYGAKIGPQLYKSYMQSVTGAGYAFRMGEFNDIGGGGETGLSNSFQSALWLLDIEFEYAALGYSGTNIHTGQYTAYNLWQFKNPNYQLQFVSPKYYGLLLFDMATGNGARLLPATVTTSANLVAWATIKSSNEINVVIINKDEAATGTVSVTVPGYSSGTATLLTAPSYVSQCKPGSAIGCYSGVTLNSSTFDGSTDGNLVSVSCPLSPQSLCNQTLTGNNGVFAVTVPITSAVLLKLQQ